MAYNASRRSVTGRHPLPKGAACSTCKVRKVRCSGASPACDACTRTARFEGRNPALVICSYTGRSRCRTHERKKEHVSPIVPPHDDVTTTLDVHVVPVPAAVVDVPDPGLKVVPIITETNPLPVYYPAWELAITSSSPSPEKLLSTSPSDSLYFPYTDEPFVLASPPESPTNNFQPEPLMTSEPIDAYYPFLKQAAPYNSEAERFLEAFYPLLQGPAYPPSPRQSFSLPSPPLSSTPPPDGFDYDYSPELSYSPETSDVWTSSSASDRGPDDPRTFFLGSPYSVPFDAFLWPL